MIIEAGKHQINAAHVLFSRRDANTLKVFFGGKDVPCVELQGTDADEFVRQFAWFGESTRLVTKGAPCSPLS